VHAYELASRSRSGDVMYWRRGLVAAHLLAHGVQDDHVPVAPVVGVVVFPRIPRCSADVTSQAPGAYLPRL
jgi:hypothetical protein